jgi:sugar phosphate isomerase/epimerase
MKKYKLGIDGANTMNCGLAGEIQILSELGYDYLEVRDYKLLEYLKDHTAKDLANTLTKKKLSPVCMSAIELKAKKYKSEIYLMMQNADWLLRTGSEIGCEMAIAAHLPPVPELLSRQQIIDWVVEDICTISDIAQKYSMKICYEFLGSRQCPVYNIEDTMEIIKRVNRKNVGWLFDVYHFHLTDGSIKSLKKADIDKLFLVHLADLKDLPFEELYVPNSRRAMPGEGIAHTEDILKTLKNLGYCGPFVVELYDEDYMTWEAKEFAKCAKENADKVLNKWFVGN